MKPTLITKRYHALSQIQGPLIFVERTPDAAFDEIVEIVDPQGNRRTGRILEVNEQHSIVQVFEGTEGLNRTHTDVTMTGDVVRLDVAPEMLGRILDATGNPIDGGPPITPEQSRDVNGAPINPAMRNFPNEFIQTGVSAIDGLNTLVRGQKLPIFAVSGLPANDLALQIAEQATVPGDVDADFAVIFAGIGITHRQAARFIDEFQSSGSMEHTVVFLNRADEPSVKRILTPRSALTAAEYLAYELGRHVLVIITDMTNYADALREISAAREEIPGRRGYPSYMYSDLATLYERAGRIHSSEGSITQMAMLTMPGDDISHPIPDLTGYITEGQIVLSRDLHAKGVYPPIDILPSLSRHMDSGIGEGKTRPDHGDLSDQLYALYAEASDLRRMSAIVGESALSDEEQKILDFATRLEQEFIGQGHTGRTIEETLDLGWELLAEFEPESLKRVSSAILDEYHRE